MPEGFTEALVRIRSDAEELARVIRECAEAATEPN
jgi:hypothetical protein